eukprot:6519320-Pyramimonas_sp.AAC.1
MACAPGSGNHDSRLATARHRTNPKTASAMLCAQVLQHDHCRGAGPSLPRLSRLQGLPSSGRRQAPRRGGAQP